MIRNKNTGMNKDFAFVEFYSAEETTLAFKAANSNDFKIQGEPVSVLYSKNRR
jgi:RNA recognition motif-containing protein